MKSFRIENGQFVYNDGNNYNKETNMPNSVDDHFVEIPLVVLHAPDTVLIDPDNKDKGKYPDLIIKEIGVELVRILNVDEVITPKASNLMDLWAQLKAKLKDSATWGQIAIRIMTKIEESESKHDKLKARIEILES